MHIFHYHVLYSNFINAYFAVFFSLRAQIFDLLLNSHGYCHILIAYGVGLCYDDSVRPSVCHTVQYISSNFFIAIFSHPSSYRNFDRITFTWGGRYDKFEIFDQYRDISGKSAKQVHVIHIVTTLCLCCPEMMDDFRTLCRL